MIPTARDQASLRSLLDTIKKSVKFNQGLVLTTVPRGGLQVAQPSNVPEALMKSYARGFHAEDVLSWQTIIRKEPLRPQDCWQREQYLGSAYSREMLVPLGLEHVVALPLTAPVFVGYPGVVHLCRTGAQGTFSRAEIQSAMAIVRDFNKRIQKARSTRIGGRCGPETSYSSGAPLAHLTVVDSKYRPQVGVDGWGELDSHLREQMIDQAKRRLNHLNGHGFTTDLAHLPDSRGDFWNYRIVIFRKYPAIGDGSFCFLCLQPGCGEWVGVRATDFLADAELSRLIPALRYMQQEFRKGPTLIDIAKTAHLSPFHFHRRFTDLLGLTPKQFMLECQIHEAKTKLVARDKELSEIARDCGFAHQSHFTSRFKQATGYTPTRWRRMVIDRGKSSR